MRQAAPGLKPGRPDPVVQNPGESMKLDSVPSVRVENLSANLAVFFANNGLPSAAFDQRRVKKLEACYADAAAREADLRARGFISYYVEPSRRMIELKWERYSDPVWQTTSIRIDVGELIDLHMDAASVAVARQSGWLRIRIHQFGDSCSFRWTFPEKVG